MAMGIRLKGQAGNWQVSDDAPTYMITEQGAISTGLKRNYPTDPGGTYLYCQTWLFANVITTAEPPLVFCRFFNMCMITSFSFLGGPGNWRGVVLGTGIGYNVDLAADGEYFVASGVVPKSLDKIGIRIRNKTTNEVIFDSGYRLAKFLSFVSTVSLDNSNFDKWNAAGAGGYWPLSSATKPAGAFLCMNPFQGYICDGISSGGVRGVPTIAFDPVEPTKIRLGVNGGSGAAIANGDMTYFSWMFVFAQPGL